MKPALIIVGLFLIFGVPAGAAGSTVRLTVGPTVHVSAKYPRQLFRELTADADPADSRRLVVCLNISPKQPSDLNVTSILFQSTDGGATWRTLLQNFVAGAQNVGDPVCKYSADGKLIEYATLTNPGPIAVVHDFDGKSWHDARVAQADRETLIIGPKHSTYLAFRQGSVVGLSPRFFGAKDHPQMIAFFQSSDDAHAFSYLTGYAYDQPHEGAASGIGSMFTDGSVIEPVAYFNTDKEFSTIPKAPHVSGKIIALTPGPMTLYPQKQPNVVSPLYYCRWDNSLSYVPVSAVDTTHSPYRNRAYVVWGDYRSGRCQEMISISQDHGKTWSAPHPISDDRGVRPHLTGPDDGTQAIAINNRGAIGVMWYDRRNAPDNVSYQPRFAVSIDGGKSFSRSVALTSASNDWQRRYLRLEDPFGFINSAAQAGVTGKARPHMAKGTWSAMLEFGEERGGETSGLTADRDGVFHASWIDNRTNVEQLYTAAVSVNGRLALSSLHAVDREVDQLPSAQPSAITACPSGGSPLTNAQLNLPFDNTWIDQKTGILSTDAFVVPKFGKRLESPLLLRIEHIGSLMGKGSALDASGKLVARPCFVMRSDRATHLVFRLTNYHRVTAQTLGNLLEFLSLKGQVLQR